MYKIGSIVEGKITGIQKYGIFVALDDNYTGLIHISEISHSFVKNIEDYISNEDVIQARIIEIDEESKHLKLSIKDLANPQELFTNTKKGFKSLQENLKPWIEEKLAEINKLD